MLLAARARAREIVTAAQAEAVETVEAERRQAWQMGYTHGLAQAHAEMAPAMKRLATLAANAAVEHDDSLRNLDEEILALTLAVARAVLRQEVRTSPDSIAGTVRAALQEMTLATSVHFHVHPDDLDTLQSHLPALSLPPTVHATVLADPTVSRGGCLIESGACRVDGTIEKQLDRVEVLLRERLHDV
jgi:flagellar assembly protein FliH